MERSLVLGEISRRQTVSHYHIHVALKHLFDHFRCGLCRIGIIPVRHDITFRIDLTEHSADDISFSLTMLIAYDRSGFARDLICMIRGIVVIYIDHCLRQHTFKICHYFFNGLALIIARYQYCNLVHFFLLKLYSVIF